MAKKIIEVAEASQELQARKAAAIACLALDAERISAEKAIVREIFDLADKYDAIVDIAIMEDISIPSLQKLASDKQVSYEDMSAALTRVSLLKWQLEAVVGCVWAECWQGLKSRFAGYWQELTEGK